MIRPATADDFDFVNDVLRANGLSEWGREVFQLRIAVPAMMLVDEGVGFSVACLVAGKPNEGYCSHLLRYPAEESVVVPWWRQMIKAMVAAALAKVPTLKLIHVHLPPASASTCIKPAALQKVGGVLLWSEGEGGYTAHIEPRALLAWANNKRK